MQKGVKTTRRRGAKLMIPELRRLCDAYVELVKKIGVVKKVYLSSCENRATVYTVIDAPPFEEKLIDSVIDAELKVLRMGGSDVVIAFDLTNLQELDPGNPVSIEGIIPADAKLVWEGLSAYAKRGMERKVIPDRRGVTSTKRPLLYLASKSETAELLRLCNAYVNLVKKIDVVQKVYFGGPEHLPIIFTVIDTPPSAEELPDPVIDAELQVMRMSGSDILLDYRLTNLQRLEPGTPPEAVVPAYAKLLWQRTKRKKRHETHGALP